MRVLQALGRIPAILLAFAATTATVSAQASQENVERHLAGKWMGAAGTPLDRVPLGFEFKRDSAGAFSAFLYFPVVNFYGLNAGKVEIDSGRYVIRNWVLRFVAEGDSLQGTMFFNRVPVTLKRTRDLPAEAPLPKIPAPGDPLWQTKLGAPVYAAAVLHDDVAYIGTSGGLFHAIDASTGKFIWTFEVGRPVHGAATVTDSAVYFVSDLGFLHKLARKDGKEVWRYDLGDQRTPRVLQHQVIENSGPFGWDLNAPTPVLHDGAVIVGAGTGNMHAVSDGSGQRIWMYEGRTRIRGTAVVDSARVIFGNFGSAVIALDRRTGTKLWEHLTAGPVVTSVRRVGDRIVAGNRNGILAAIDIATGKRAWAVQLWGSSAESEATAVGDSLFYFGSSDLRRVSLIDVRDGRVLWRTDVYGWAWARPVVSGDLLIVSTVGATPYQMRHLGALTALNRVTGRIVWRWAAKEPVGGWGYGFAAPAAVDGKRIVVGGLDGSLYGFSCCGT